MSYYHDLNRATIELIVKLFREGNHDELSRLGTSPDLAKRLCHLHTQNFVALSQFRGAIINFQSNDDLIRLLVDRFELESNREIKINDLIQLGASQPMLEVLVGVDRTEYQRYCRMIELSSETGSVIGPGRPRLLTDDETRRVNDITRDLDDTGINDPLERLLLLGRKSQIPLHCIWRYLRGHQDSDETDPRG